jgi:pSer/pThr/pTyr-binding forkhead associated (FHA) protein
VELHLIGDDLVVRDLGSVNGTWVNAEKIDAEAKLKDGDVLQFDRIKFIVSSPT